MEINYDKIIEKRKIWKQHTGFLPLLIRATMMKQHRKSLLEAGTYDTTIKKEIRSKPQTMKEAEQELLEWVERNPEHKDLIIW